MPPHFSRHGPSVSFFAAVCVIVALAFAPSAHSQPAGDRMTALLEQIEARQREVRSLEASFVQVKSGGLFLTPETSHGRFFFLAPDRVRWEYVQPARTVLVLGREVWTLDPATGGVEHTEIGRRAGQMVEALGAGGSLERLRASFELRLAQPKDPAAPYRLELKPRSSLLARRLSGITLELDRQRGFPLFLAYQEPGGARTELRFADVQLDTDQPAERFTPPSTP